MNRKDIKTDVLYAVDRVSGEPNCVRVIDNETRVRRAGYVDGHPLYKRTDTNSPNTGYAVVVIDPAVKGARERALEITLRKFFEATSEKIGDGLRLAHTQTFRKYVGQYDQVMSERKVEAERAAKELAERRQRVDAEWRLHGFLTDELYALDVRASTRRSEPRDGIISVVSVDFQLDELRKLVAMAKAGKRLYDAITPDADGVPQLEKGRGDELAYDAWNELDKVLHPQF